ncbi:MAG: cupin domain-containing protein [Chitinophagaceae bacterium]
MKSHFITAIASLASLSIGCMENISGNKATELHAIFPKGEKGAAENFIGNAWNTPLVANDSTYNTVIGNVYFEPGARSNWHTHPSGQILIITGGVGFHQIKGQPKQTIKKGDVVKCPPNVLHWHGASPGTGMQQLYILPKTERGIVTWLQKVTDEEYNNTK